MNLRNLVRGMKRRRKKGLPVGLNHPLGTGGPLNKLRSSKKRSALPFPTTPPILGEEEQK